MIEFQVYLTKKEPSGEMRYDISEIAGETDFQDNINVSGICTLSVLRDEVVPDVGNRLEVICDGIRYFDGFIFKTGHSHEEEIKVTAYDSLRYLKANETKVFKDKTASQIVKELCNDMKLPMGVIEESSFPLGTMIFDDKCMLDMIASGVTKTVIGTKNLFFLKNIAGKVEFRNIKSCIQDILIAPDSLLFGYSYERDIDTNTFNQIKLVRDNKQTGKREIYMAKDSNNITRWGTLQYYEKVDDEMNPEQIKQKADSLLYLKNRVKQTLTNVEVLGDKRLRSGNMIYLSIPEIGLDKFLLCTAARHTFSDAAHSLKADFKLV